MQTKFDKIDYALFSANNTDTNQPCEISGTLERHIVPSNLTDYQVCVTSLNFPSFDIPIIKLDPFNTGWLVTMDYYYYDPATKTGTWFYYTGQVSIIPRTYRPSAQGLIYEATQVIEMVNRGMLGCMINLDDNVFAVTGQHIPGWVPGPALPFDETKPTLHLNQTTNKISMWELPDYYQDTLMVMPDKVGGGNGGILNVYFNRALYLKIAGLDVYSTPSEIYKFRIICHYYGDNQNSTETALVNTQQGDYFATMSELVSIQVITNLPIQNKYTKTGSINNVLFELKPLELTGGFRAGVITYNVIYPFAWKDIISPAQLNDVWFKVYYIMVDGSTSIVNLPPRGSASIDLLFQKKSTSNY